MSAIKQAFSASLRPVTPLHAFHRLCVKLNHTNDIQHRLNLVSNVVETISEGEKFYINRKLKVSFCDQKSVFFNETLIIFKLDFNARRCYRKTCLHRRRPT